MRSSVRLLLKRVTRAEVRVEGRAVGRIAEGLVVLVRVVSNDNASVSETMAGRVAEQRLFRYEVGRANR